MKIIDLDGGKIRAYFVLDHGNCEISVSTIFNKDKPEIAIFDKHSGEILKSKVISIEWALAWINNFGPRD